MDATGTCLYRQQYYLVYPDGDAVECRKVCYDAGPCENICNDEIFSSPPGLDALDGTNFGHITKAYLI